MLGSLLAAGLQRSCPLGGTPADHPCLWGEIALAPPPPLLIEHDAALLPTRRTGESYPWWTTRKQGGVDSQGRPIPALTDIRGHRSIYPLPADAGACISTDDGEHRSFVLYGGTLYEHFGHLIVDLSRLYRLLTLFRRSRAPIWFHYPAIYPSKLIEHPLVTSWLNCLGIEKRVRVVHCTLHCEQLVSSPVLYRDRCFVTTDFPGVARHALGRKIRRRLLGLQPEGAPIAYLSRHKLSTGTNGFDGEHEVVEALGKLGNVDVIVPEELSIEAKLSLYRRYRLVTGFVQAAMLLKYFVPTRQPGDLAEQLLLVAGPKSLNSNWVNLERAYGFGDQLLDCTLSTDALRPKLRRRLLGLKPEGAPIAYLARNKLSTGTTCFDGEDEVVEALGKLGNVDVIVPEELSIEAKLSLYRRYRLVTGFAQAAMLLKYFAPTRQPGDLAEQLLLVAGPQSLNSNWVNLERAYGFGDQLLDCSLPADALKHPDSPDSIDLGGPNQASGFQRQHRFDVGLVIDQLRLLAKR